MDKLERNKLNVQAFRLNRRTRTRCFEAQVKAIHREVE
jgi:hypothetical protein